MVGIKNPYFVRECARTNKSKYYCFHKSHDHNTNDWIKLNDAIEVLIKMRRLSEYTKDGKRSKEDSPERKQSHKPKRPPPKTLRDISSNYEIAIRLLGSSIFFF